jgi:farnesyl-diphosphate farnesyltransferase
MPSARPSSDKSLRALLQGVSRSFFLSIQLLPSGLRRPVAVGYLLARASDTIADAPGLSRDERLKALDDFASAVRGQAALPDIRSTAGMTPDEQRLVQQLPQCLAALDELAPADQDDVFAVLGHIVRGQRLDVERFGDATAGAPRSLASAAELDEYTYLVAGCVGEFWTKLGFRHVPRFADRPAEEMLELGRRYGMALQLVNVLRDADGDLAMGRRYLPAQEAAPQPWIERAQSGLECGMRYAGALRNARVRVATALPALIGARTLALLRTQGPGAKVPRAQVRSLLWRVLLTLGRNTTLQREFRRVDNDTRSLGEQWENRPR